MTVNPTVPTVRMIHVECTDIECLLCFLLTNCTSYFVPLYKLVDGVSLNTNLLVGGSKTRVTECRNLQASTLHAFNRLKSSHIIHHEVA